MHFELKQEDVAGGRLLHHKLGAPDRIVWSCFQVKGLQMEYGRLLEQKENAPVGGGIELTSLQTKVSELQKEASHMKVC
jgi:hypothetical protein